MALLFYVVARGSRGERDESDMFRYPAPLVRFVFVLSVGFPVVSAVVIYSTFSPRPRGFDLYLFFGIWTALLVAFLAGFAYLKRFYIKWAGDRIVIRGFRTRVVNMGQALRVVLIEGGRGGKELYIYDRSNALVLKIGSTLEDFEGLSSMVREYAERSGTRYEERDRWGNWIRS